LVCSLEPDQRRNRQEIGERAVLKRIKSGVHDVRRHRADADRVTVGARASGPARAGRPGSLWPWRCRTAGQELGRSAMRRAYESDEAGNMKVAQVGLWRVYRRPRRLSNRSAS